MTRAERADMQCMGCGYRLNSLAGHCCPECGRKYDPADARTFDILGQRLRAARIYILVAMGCSLYPLVVMASMITAVVDRVKEHETLREVGYLAFHALACAGLLVLAGTVSLLVAAPIAARYARSEIWILWSSAVALAAITWMSLLILFGFLMPAIAL